MKTCKELFDLLKKKYGEGCAIDYTIDDIREEWVLSVIRKKCKECGDLKSWDQSEYSTKEELIKGVEELCA